MDYEGEGGAEPVSIQSSVFLVYRSNVTGMRSLQAPAGPPGRTHPCRLRSRSDLWGGDKVRMIDRRMDEVRRGIAALSQDGLQPPPAAVPRPG